MGEKIALQEERDAAWKIAGSLLVGFHGFQVVADILRSGALSQSGSRKKERKSHNNDQSAEHQAVHSQHGFAVALHQCQALECHGEQTREERASQPSRHANFALHVRLANPQHDQRDEFQ